MHINSTASSQLNTQLNQLVKNNTSKLHLKINMLPTDDDLAQLSAFIINYTPFPIAKLSIQVDLKTLENPYFIYCIEQLNKTLVSSVELRFSDEEMKRSSKEINDALTRFIAPIVSFPVQIISSEKGVVPSQLQLTQFQNIIIDAIQKRNKNKTDEKDSGKTTNKSKRDLDPLDPMGKKIKLKELINHKKGREETVDHYVSLEVEHVEIVEENISQQEVVEVEDLVEMHEVQEYSGQLLGFKEFSEPLYKNKVEEHTRNQKHTQELYDLLEKELFANLPHAIKFVSPDAAEQLAANLSSLVTLNKHNLPNGFQIKRTPLGELVLDYDAYLENENANPFTPVVAEYEVDPIYPIEFKMDEVKKWINDDQLFNILCPAPYQTPHQLINLWIKYCEEGTISFFNELKQATQAQPQLLPFLMENYLVHLPQWDHLFNNKSFFTSLERVNHYDEQKLKALKSFLKNGSSPHDLSKTVSAFELFWNELNLLCTEQKVSINGINEHQWFIPKGGNPVVYMERMLVILKNARKLEDQFKLLTGISLENYGAYYASRFEGFNAVSAEMHLTYDPALNQGTFNKNFNQYRVDLDTIIEPFITKISYFQISYIASFYAKRPENKFWLVNCTNELPQPLNLEQLKNDGLIIPFDRDAFLPPYQFYSSNPDGSMKLLYSEVPMNLEPEDAYASCFRFIGLQTSGITASSLKEQFDKYKLGFIGDTDLSAELIASLFFISHERFIDTQSLTPLFNTLNRASIHKEVITSSIKLLAKVYTLDIKLNQVEGMMIFESIANMNSAEFEGLGLSKVECINKLLTQFESNKFAAFKLFDFRSKNMNPKWPFLYALDTADFLAQDPIIDATYHDDLLLFSGLINRISEEVYFHKRFPDAAAKESPLGKRILANMEQVKHYLHQAAIQDKPNNLQYSIQVMLNAKETFTYEQFLTACAEIEALPAFDSKRSDQILGKNKFVVGAELPEIFTKDNSDLKAIMILLIVQLEELKIGPSEPFDKAALSLLSVAELQVQLKKSWQEAGTLLTITQTLFLTRVLKTTRDIVIKSAFGMLNSKGLLKIIGEKIQDLPDFQDCGDFEKINGIAGKAQNIADLFRKIGLNSFVMEHEEEFIALFKRVDFSQIEYETLYSVLFLLTSMPQRNYLPLLNTFFADNLFISKKEHVTELLNHLTFLNNNYFPSEYLDAVSKLVIATPGNKETGFLVSKMIKIYQKNNKDPILELLMSRSDLTLQQVGQMLTISGEIEDNREKVSSLLFHLIQTKKLETFLKEIDKRISSGSAILEIISIGHALNRKGVVNSEQFEYTDLISMLLNLTPEEIGMIFMFYESTPVSTDCLYNALKLRDKSEDFSKFLSTFEKAPFGKRDFSNQFSITEVERVVNQSKDLMNNSAYSHQYRKQLMEAFLFVNEAGEHLPVFYNKPAKDLTNHEIKSFFAELKAKKNAGLTPFQRRLLALTLIREAMYRSTGEFPYSTQVIALIDGVMHQGDFISNIDTGQGKSLIDSMKAVLLWLDSDRVDLTTSSLVDARRDIANYGPFMKLLEIPYSTSPISSKSSSGDFQKNGINFSTFAQLSLFFSKAKVTGFKFEKPETSVSLVANESDYTFLDDRVTYRFATNDGAGVSYGQEWLYYGINEFVARPEFISNDKTVIGEDIDDLKQYLKIKARQLNKSEKIVEKFSDTQYLTWLESALSVNYLLKENVDYVIPDEFEKKSINGVELRSKVVKILMKDGKVSQDSTFGNGVQQLLCAYLNNKLGASDFIIEPQNKTIISTNNKNLIDYYRGKKGFIWGSSGSVGAKAEIQEQFKKYGFEFSKFEPHQKNRVVFKAPIIEADEAAQFKKLIVQLTQNPKVDSPSIVFLKDINTATRFFKELEQHNPKKFPLQLYTGLGKEEDFIRNASKPGMITITTSALGRNTDIHYDRIKGLRVWHTYVDSTRGSGQKSGRTGRQGSAGEVHYILNAQDLGGKNTEEIQAKLDELAAVERNVNEDLYNVLGYLLSIINEIPGDQFTKGKIAFLHEQWSQFSTATEAGFRENHRNASKGFVLNTLAVFNNVLAAAVKTPVAVITLDNVAKAIKQQHRSKAAYKADVEEVTIQDCTVPTAIAYQLLNTISEDADPEGIKQAIKTKLAQLFKKMNRPSFVAEQREYLRYLTSTPATQKVVVEAHKEFITSYLQEHSQQLSVFDRWFGNDGPLNELVSNEAYLLMFHSFTSISNQPIVDLDVIKSSVNQLLNEYLETSWFISSERRTWASDLKNTINEAEDIDSLLSCLSKTQIDVAKKDIEENKNRILKPLHLFGHSRYQTTLGKALNLAASLSGKTEVNEVINGLTPLLPEVTDSQPVSEMTIDELRFKARYKKSDEQNASVIIKALDNALNIKQRKNPIGMVGRSSLFNSVDLTRDEEARGAQELFL